MGKGGGGLGREAPPHPGSALANNGQVMPVREKKKETQRTEKAATHGCSLGLGSGERADTVGVGSTLSTAQF